MKKNKVIYIAGITIIFLIILVAVFNFESLIFESQLPDNLISIKQAEDIIIDQILANDEEKEGIVAYLYPDVLKPKDLVASWDEEIPTKKLKNYTWLAWIDRQPGAVFYGHPTQFVYIDAETSEYEIVDQEFWPVVNEMPFEGDDSLALYYDRSTARFLLPLLSNKNITPDFISNLFGIEAMAAQAQHHMHIDATQVGALPEHHHYAVIFSGFGRNDWIFLEGAHQMYHKLKSIGYSDDNIIFRAPIRARISDSWNRRGRPRNTDFVETTYIDGGISPRLGASTFTSLAGRSTWRDSVFVFILAHGSKGNRGQFKLGRPFAQRETMGTDDPLIGKGAKWKSNEFAPSIMSIEACELMLVLDSCYAGVHEPHLRANYNDNRIQRLAVAHSTNSRTISFGADFKYPDRRNVQPRIDLDAGGTVKTVADTNSADIGGEFSSGFIENMGQGIFAPAFLAAKANDAAYRNQLTHPYMWTAGRNGPCATMIPAILSPPEIFLQPQDAPAPPPEPQDQPEDEPEDEPDDEESSHEEESQEVAIEPGIIDFTYDHANPSCPLSITPITITGPDETSWSITSDLPIWLSAGNTSGTGPATIPMYFPCQLDVYENQQQSTNVDFLIQTPDGQYQEASVKVNGNFTNF